MTQATPPDEPPSEELDRPGRLTRQQIRETFAGANPKHPLLVALRQVLADWIRQEHISARNPNLAEAQMRYQLGREAALEDLEAAICQMQGRITGTK